LRKSSIRTAFRALLPANPARMTEPRQRRRYERTSIAVHFAPWFASFTGLLLSACAAVNFAQPGSLAATPPESDPPYFAEFCALSQIKEKPGFGANIRGQVGGHSIFYLQGACRAATHGQTTLQPCDEAGAEPADGVGISMNSHFRNAKWVATPGRNFFFNGNLAPGQKLTLAGYDMVQAEAKRLGIYDGVVFHKNVFDDIPAGMAPEDWKYEVSIATDYGISLGRGRFCARVPVNHPQLVTMVNFLNAQNAPYRDGGQVFYWSLFRDNCIHLAHNALHQAGLWPEWPTEMPLLVAMFDFPVPRNELVNLMRRTSDIGLIDPLRLNEDPDARRALLEFGQLPLRPGALMESRPPQQPNDVYDTDLALVFYDEPGFGHYQPWFDAIQADPRLHDPRANLAWVAAQYRQALETRRPLSWWLARPGLHDPAGFAVTYRQLYKLLDRQLMVAEHQLASLGDSAWVPPARSALIGESKDPSSRAATGQPGGRW
jgi:hypothetical protein